jgi:gas vesicle protein
MRDYEIELDRDTSKRLGAIVEAGDDVLLLARIAEIDPDEFRDFLREYGETENQDALELLQTAESLQAAESVDQQRAERILARVKYLFMGGGIGAIVGLLFAPKPGYVVRGDMADATRKGIDRSREAAQQLGDRAGEYYEATRERASELYTEASQRASDIYSQAAEKVGEVAQTARETATRETSTVAAAIDAGKKAYQEEKRKTELSGRIEAEPKYRESVD